jgi:hypothetical protein
MFTQMSYSKVYDVEDFMTQLEALFADPELLHFHMETSEGDRRSTFFLFPKMTPMDAVMYNFKRGLDVLVLHMKCGKEKRVTLKQRPDLADLGIDYHTEFYHESSVPLLDLVDFVMNPLDDINPYFLDEVEPHPLKKRFNPGLSKTLPQLFDHLDMYLKTLRKSKCTCVTIHNYQVSETNLYWHMFEDMDYWIDTIKETLKNQKAHIVEFWYADYKVETVYIEVENKNTEELKLCLFVHGVKSRYSINVLQSWDVDMLKTLLSAHERSPKDKFRVKCEGKLLEDGKGLWDYDLSDFKTLSIYIPGPGGAPKQNKRARAADDDAHTFTVLTPPTVFNEDLQIVKDAQKINSIDIPAWVSTLTEEQAKQLVEVMDKQAKTGKISALIDPYLDFVAEYKALKVQVYSKICKVNRLFT